MSMKNSSDNIGNRTSDIPAFSAVPQPTASQRVPGLIINIYNHRIKQASVIYFI